MALLTSLVRVYFELSYRLLLDSASGRAFLERARPDGDPATHGYLTHTDLDVLLATFHPSSGDELVDLGCGVGDVALEVHRQTGARILGIDGSDRAIAEARKAAAQAGAAPAVHFMVGDLRSPPVTDARGAYAIDSLMFLPDPAATLATVAAKLHPSAPLFATLLTFGRTTEASLRARLASRGLRVETLDDVTPALRRRSRRRRTLARTLLRAPSVTPRGRLAMLLVLGEESLVSILAARGRLRRWRLVVRRDGRANRSEAPGRPEAPNVTFLGWSFSCPPHMVKAIGRTDRPPPGDARPLAVHPQQPGTADCGPRESPPDFEDPRNASRWSPRSDAARDGSRAGARLTAVGRQPSRSGASVGDQSHAP